MGVRIQIVAGGNRDHERLITALRRLAHAGPRRPREVRLGLEPATRKAD